MDSIVDISSDDEPSWAEPKESDDSFDWISELLKSEDDKELYDSDELMVVGEVNAKKKSRSSKSTVIDEDDECVILEGDPDNPVAAITDLSGSDEVLIVGAKGQIACRDYPHPRHLCAKFPFSSTLHESHCDQCHCYVCESLAPCVHWGTGISSSDHCHATAKEEIWKIRRKDKLDKDAPLQASQIFDTSLSVPLIHCNQVAPLNIMGLASNSMPQNKVSRPTTVRACPTSTNYTVPNIIGQGRRQPSVPTLAKNRLQTHLGSQQLLGVRNNVIRRDRPNTGILHSGSFKRTTGIAGAAHRFVYGSSNNINSTRAVQGIRNATPSEPSNDRSSIRWQDVRPSINLESYRPQNSPLPNLDGFDGNTVPLQPQIHSQPIPLSNDGQNFCQQGYESQNASQGIYQHGFQGLNASQLICAHGNQIQSATDPGFSDFNLSWPNNSGQSNQQPPIEETQVQRRDSIHEPSPVKESSSQFLESIDLSQSNQQADFFGSAIPSQRNQELPVENFQHQSTGSIFEPSPVKESSCQFTGTTDLSSVDFEYDNWCAMNLDGCVLSDLNIYSPEPSSVEPGMVLFD